MSTDLVPFDHGLPDGSDRQRALAELNRAAETTDDLSEARQIMMQGRAIADLLSRARAPFEEARLAGKASTVAARRLGRMIGELPGDPRYVNGNKGPRKSERREVVEDLGLSYSSTARDLVRLSRIADPDFQRYIQGADKIPSVNGAIRACNPEPRHFRREHRDQWTAASRRRRVGVKTPINPSLDEAYSLIVNALGHLSTKAPTLQGGNKKLRAIADATEHLYAAEDILKPYRGGYVK